MLNRQPVLGLGITLDEEGEVVVVVAIGDDEDETADVESVQIAPETAVQIAWKMMAFAIEGRSLEMRMDGMTVEERIAEVEAILMRNQAGQN